MHLLILQRAVPLITNEFVSRLNEGGPLFMYTALLILIAILVLLVKAFMKPENNEKAINLVKHLSLFVLVWGFLGQMIGLIGAFDAIQAQGNIAPGILASGIKVAALSPTFGMVTFLIARLGIVVFIWLKK